MIRNEQFEALSRREQIRRLRVLAREALSAYELGAYRLSLISNMSNTTFRVDAASGQRYVLRIHRVGTPTVESVGSELVWLAAIRRDTDLQVPDPVLTRSGQLLTVASTPGVPTPQICVLFRWLYGRRVDERLTPAHMALSGELMARLQNHAEQFEPPPGFVRGRVDGPSLADRMSQAGLSDPFSPASIQAYHHTIASALSLEEADLTVTVLDMVRALEEVLVRGPDAFGLIHADLHQNNLLFAPGAVKAIDFDDSGFGPWLYDLAVPLTMLMDREDHPALRAGLLAGYRKARPLSTEHESYIDTFMALRILQDAIWVLQERKHPALNDNESAVTGDQAALARQVLAPLPAFLASGGHFPI